MCIASAALRRRSGCAAADPRPETWAQSFPAPPAQTANNTEISRALFIGAQAGYWKLMASPERFRVYAMLNYIGTPLTKLLGYAPP